MEKERYELKEVIVKDGSVTVFKCRDSVTKETVALKRIFFEDENEGVPNSVIREVSLLKELEHTNVIRLLDVLDFGPSLDLVFEYMDYDLKKFIQDYPEIAKDPLIIKSFLLQILHGVSYCHSHKIIHRDLKPENLLIDPERKAIKLADFRLARAIGIRRKTYTKEVSTLKYTAPELLMESDYSFPLDMWSVGCIFAEMVTQKALFDGTTWDTILPKIFSMLGVPNEETWPGVTSIYGFYCYKEKFPSSISRNLAEEVSNLEPAGIDLLFRMLCLDPSRRITAFEALKHPYLQNVVANP